MDASFESPSPPNTPPRAGSRIAVVFLVAGLVAVAGFAAWRGAGRAKSGATAQNAVVELAVDGMSCVGCAGAVASTLEEVPGVGEVTVDYDHRIATIRLEDRTVETGALIAALEDAGYKARVER